MPDVFPKSARLLKREEFLRVQAGKRLQEKHFVALSAVGTANQSRLGIGVSRKTGNAVLRNRLKRVVREAMRRRLAALPTLDLVVIPRPALAAASREDVAAAFDSLVRRLGGSPR